jgi:tripartite-type tricarboxylate transporter receptor subunit TctC
MNLTRRQLISLAAATAAVLATGSAAAQSWPSKTITMIVSYPAGGDTDAVARLLADKLAAQLGQQVVVDNRPGASGAVGNAYVAHAAPDGYTLLFTPSTFPIAPLVLKLGQGVAHDVVKDFTPISLTGTIPLLLVSNPASGIKFLKQIVDDGKAGKKQTYASPGIGSPMQVVAEVFNRDAGIKVDHIPYKGVAPEVVDLLGGQVTMAWVTPGAVAQYLGNGRVAGLAISDVRRSPLLPNVPTFTELGYKNVNIAAWFGILGPRGLPPAITARVNGAVNDILRMPDIVEKLKTFSVIPVGGEPALLARKVQEDHDLFARLVKEFNIQAD